MPNASRWNIGRVRSTGVGTRVGHVHFILFVSILFALGAKRESGFWWNMGFKPSYGVTICPYEGPNLDLHNEKSSKSDAETRALRATFCTTKLSDKIASANLFPQLIMERKIN